MFTALHQQPSPLPQPNSLPQDPQWMRRLPPLRMNRTRDPSFMCVRYYPAFGSSMHQMESMDVA